MKLMLERQRFCVDVAYCGHDGEEYAYINEYDVILLDLNLPDKDGIDVLKHLRDIGDVTPVIIITARDEVKERAFGLNLGADDYVVKPFEMLELKARIQAVIRRYNGRVNPIISIGPLTINPMSRIAKINDKELELSIKEFDILEYIATNHPNVISSEKIAEHIYDENYNPFSSVLRVHIARLRKKLCSSAGYDIFITTRGKGYSLCIK